ncbi:MAG: hypothetical protein NT003_04390 [Candidatus Magasanikbacteria bacterium]|nr:hypothetical protein [Candidatus Magasanikbacteria bacterium]
MARMWGRQEAFARAMEKRGVSFSMIEELLLPSNSACADEMAALMRRQHAEIYDQTKPLVSESHAAARTIMGDNFLGLEEVELVFGVRFSKAQRAQLAEIPFSAELLRECAQTHVLAAGFPTWILHMQQNPKFEHHLNELFFCLQDGPRYEAYNFVHTLIDVRWFLLRKQPIRNTSGRLYDAQVRKIPQGEEVPWAREVVFVAVAMYMRKHERLFTRMHVNCRDTYGPHNFRVCVKSYDDRIMNQGITLDSDFGLGRKSSYRGICSVRYA